jgi:hypothetical protein
LEGWTWLSSWFWTSLVWFSNHEIFVIMNKMCISNFCIYICINSHIEYFELRDFLFSCVKLPIFLKIFCFIEWNQRLFSFRKLMTPLFSIKSSHSTIDF